MAAVLFHPLSIQGVRATQDVPVVTFSYCDMRAPNLAAFPQKGQIAMVGDSLSELAPWNGMFPNEEIANYGISGDTVEGVLARVPCILASHASKLFVMIGINNLRAVGEFDHSVISHSCGGPWAQRRPGLRRIHVMHVHHRP
jgi:hypothetical protein